MVLWALEEGVRGSTLKVLCLVDLFLLIFGFRNSSVATAVRVGQAGQELALSDALQVEISVIVFTVISSLFVVC